MPIERVGEDGFIATGAGVDTVRLVVLKNAINMYLRSGMQANRMYTPENMRRVVSQYTGIKYSRSKKGLRTALDDLENLLKQVN